MRQDAAEHLLGHYEVLEVEPEATPEQIGQAARRGYIKYHPDTAACPDVNKFNQVRQAHKVLGDCDLRAAYDGTFREIAARDEHTTTQGDREGKACIFDGSVFLKNVIGVFQGSGTDRAA